MFDAQENEGKKKMLSNKLSHAFLFINGCPKVDDEEDNDDEKKASFVVVEFLLSTFLTHSFFSK